MCGSDSDGLSGLSCGEAKDVNPSEPPKKGSTLHMVSGSVTSGSTLLTLTGVFPSSRTVQNLRVQIGAADCYDLLRGGSSELLTQTITCRLPEGVGALIVPSTYVNGVGYLPADGSARVSFGAPTVASVAGCARADGAKTLDCVRTGGTQIVVTGTNFGSGARGALVLVNGNLCSRIDGVADSHTTIHCELSSGVILDAPVQVLQSGAISVAQNYVSFEQCTKGQRQVGLQCDDCASGRFSATPNADECSSCKAGTFAAAPGSTLCVECTPGRLQGTLASSRCNDCGAGLFASKAAQSSCDVCEAGTFSATGAAACSICPHGKHAAEKGGGGASEAAVACFPCVGRQYTPGARSTSCLSCGEGTYLPYARASSCFNCPGERVTCADGVASLH